MPAHEEGHSLHLTPVFPSPSGQQGSLECQWPIVTPVPQAPCPRSRPPALLGPGLPSSLQMALCRKGLPLPGACAEHGHMPPAVPTPHEPLRCRQPLQLEPVPQTLPQSLHLHHLHLPISPSVCVVSHHVEHIRHSPGHPMLLSATRPQRLQGPMPC